MYSTTLVRTSILKVWDFSSFERKTQYKHQLVYHTEYYLLRHRGSKNVYHVLIFFLIALFPLIYNIYIPQQEPFPSSMFASEPDPKWQGSEDKWWGLAVKWWVFFFILPHQFPLFKSVTHYMSGQQGTGIKFSSLPRLWPESYWDTVTAKIHRERQNWERRDVQRIVWRREEAEKEESMRQREGKLEITLEVCMCVWWGFYSMWKNLKKR